MPLLAALLLSLAAPRHADAAFFRRDPPAQVRPSGPQVSKQGPAVSAQPAVKPEQSAAVEPLTAAPALLGRSETPQAAASPAELSVAEQAQFEALFDGRRRAPLMELKSFTRAWSTPVQLEKLNATAPVQPGSVRFAVIGDSDPGEFWFIRLANVKGRGMFAKLLTRAAAEGEFIVQLGDMLSRGTLKNFRDLIRQLRALGLTRPFLTVPGNHERSTPRAKRPGNNNLYQWVFGSSDHYFDRGGARFLFLDTSARRLTPRQLRWLDESLAAPADIRHKIIFTHIAPEGLAPWTDFLGAKGVGSFGPGSAEFMEIAARRGVDRVYFGHVHGFDIIDRGGVRYVLTGGGGSPLFALNIKDRFHHYLSVEAGPDGIRETVRKAAGGDFSLLPPRR